ncbi:hypothetical protein KL911_000106 [Ogataea haglerorum]|uniref:uncharacterized protein n=1 Tax=Ogataea haglerorum TaxID=1937702 RepID=UPI001C89F324|nr:uncharacterized protein KL911_000106 [Ogataea haglerorum]KAG7758969.1 hypothetical protein KL911_000106 [Ogataea haglerorum]
MTKRYICQFCARSFSRSEHKLRHERSHTKEKPFQCSICKNGFVRRDLLQRHLRTVHGLVLKHSIDGNISTNDDLLKSPSTANGGPGEMVSTDLQFSALPTSPSDLDHMEDNAAILAEKTVVSLLTLSNRFRHLNMELKNSITNYIIVFGSSKKWQEDLPSTNINKLLAINELDEMLYLVVCLGACLINEFEDAITMFNKSWEIIIDKITNSKINYNSGEIFNRFVDNLIILGCIYLNYFINFSNSSKYSYEQLHKKIAIPIDVLFEYLNNIISTHMANRDGQPQGTSAPSKHSSDIADHSSRRGLEPFYWNAYLLLSHYSFVFNKSPSSLHLYLLDKNLPEEHLADQSGSDETLGQLITNLSVISGSYQNFVNHDDLTLKEKAIICGLMNELQMVKFNETNKLSKNVILQQGLFKDNKNFLHNAIILANKNFNVSAKLASNYDDEFIRLLSIVKRKLLVNCPLKFTDLLSNYLIIPKGDYNWTLLALTLKEFIFETESLINDKNFLNNDKPIIEFDLSKMVNLLGIESNSSNTASELTDEEIYKNIHSFISTPFNYNFLINNNLGITLLPCLLLALILNENSLMYHRKFLNLPVNNLIMVEFIIGNFLMLIRILNFYRKKYLIDLSNPLEKNWTSRNTSHPPGTSNNPNTSEDEEQGDEEEDESIILSVIFYVINELGRKYTYTPPVAGERRRANSISIGEFSNNNEKMKKMMGSKETKHGSDKPEDTLKAQITNDIKYQNIMKNVQSSFLCWLKLYQSDFAQLEQFIRVLCKVLENDIYSRLQNQKAGGSPHSLDVFNLISSHTQPNPESQFYGSHITPFGQRAPPSSSNDTGYYQHNSDHYGQQKLPSFVGQHLQGSLSPPGVNPILMNKDDDRILLPPINQNNRHLPNPFGAPAASKLGLAGTEGLSELIQAASTVVEQDKK